MKRTQVFKDDGGSWRYRVVSGNGEILCTSEAYTRHRDARRGIEALVTAICADRKAREDESALVRQTTLHSAARRRAKEGKK